MIESWVRDHINRWKQWLKNHNYPPQSMFPVSVLHQNGFLLSDIEVNSQKEVEEMPTNELLAENAAMRTLVRSLAELDNLSDEELADAIWTARQMVKKWEEKGINP